MNYSYEVRATGDGYELALYTEDNKKLFETEIGEKAYAMSALEPERFVLWLEETFDDILEGGTSK